MAREVADVIAALAAFDPGYAPELLASLGRQPALLSIWMVNRILDATPDAAEREGWLAALRQVEHSAEAALREQAVLFLEYQAETFR